MPFLQNLQSNQSAISLTDFFTVGTDPLCQLVLDDDKISPRHLRFEKRDEGTFLRDLRSKGTLVNRQTFTEGILKNKDEIQIGSHCFQFLIEEPVLKGLGISSKNKDWQEQLNVLAEVAAMNTPVLILGHSGAGKEVLANAIHQSSDRSGPFISVNCSALTETLIESELFGHIKGSFTGATSDRKGAFEAARGGTLFLDEIGDLPYALQAKLLRALENDEIRPVGSDKIIKTNVRILAATHQNLHEKIFHKEFRSDLYFRLNVVTAQIPSLDERKEDFIDLLTQFAKEKRVRFSYDAMVALKERQWLGNIRELKNTVVRAAAFFPRQQIETHQLPRILDKYTQTPRNQEPMSLPITNRQNQLHEDSTIHRGRQTLPTLKTVEKEMIIQGLIANFGNQRKTAQELGIPKSTLHDRLRTFQLNPKDYSPVSQRESMALVQ